jgi:hypothetical protein
MVADLEISWMKWLRVFRVLKDLMIAQSLLVPMGCHV